ncbi:hypothetical protein FRZ67_04835 [Panacibacter ginsenosidivorans]|uniref:RNA polymerase alpha subunit C-terminal domain-containing protein n=1 Tax=Panacibacter ginsenosidivorans TaxID=1813871 RepID=A0A5B8V580_9BACT|nr:hypothetical protein [Panacibacter ginsenosidivorans]QEC66657.1 hypothetical protein FRZ67_04835 [Panacibacter ginsenosidivorans]
MSQSELHVASPVASHTYTVTMLFSKFKIVCMPTKKLNDEIFQGLGNPAKRALANAGIDSVKKLSSFSEKEILKLHGVGPSSIPVLKKLLEEKSLSFKAQHK